jgi:hypothetical protein
LIGLCSRACLSPGLADQGSDTQDSTWILVQHLPLDLEATGRGQPQHALTCSCLSGLCVGT